MKKLIRLTEGDIHKIVRNSVNKILKEAYDDYDYEEAYINPYYDQDRAQSLCKNLTYNIEHGFLDDELLKAYKNGYLDDWINDKADECGDWDEAYDLISPYVDDRLSYLDRNYANHYLNGENRRKQDRISYEKRYPDFRNDNVKNYSAPTTRSIHDNDQSWDDFDLAQLKKSNPDAYDTFYNKKGKQRDIEQVANKINKKYGYVHAADTRPLHRKGSLNRAFEKD